MISGILLIKIYNFKYLCKPKGYELITFVENSNKILNFSWNLHNELLMSIFFWSSPLWSSAIIEYVPKSISSKRNIVNKGLSNLEKKLFSTNWTGMNFFGNFWEPVRAWLFSTTERRPRVTGTPSFSHKITLGLPDTVAFKRIL